MFGEFIAAIAGDSGSDEEEELDEDGEEGKEHASNSEAKPFDFWSAASGLADRVKKGTAELATTVRTTDWRAEIQAFGEDLAEETEELGASAISAAQQAVDNLEHLPTTAQEALPAIEQKRRAVQAQLGQVGSSLGRFGRDFVANTTEMFEQASSAIQNEMSAAAAEGRPRRAGPAAVPAAAAGARYSRLDSDIAAMQRDSGTYCDEPENSDDYAAWLQEFDLEKRADDVAAVVRENTFMAELESRIVPLIVERDTFWRRYFYRLHLLQQAHRARTELAARAAAPQEEETPWDDDETPASPAAPFPAPAAAAAAGGRGRDISRCRGPGGGPYSARSALRRRSTASSTTTSPSSTMVSPPSPLLKADDRRAPPAARAAEAPLRRPAADSAAPTAALALRSRRLPATWPAVSASGWCRGANRWRRRRAAGPARCGGALLSRLCAARPSSAARTGSHAAGCAAAALS
mmetsp:Transcript_14536/g.43933  ORF Transcript_14536/g.43933 Transcript_14536/m.43933 type:complete len:464 (+) Transcript_14536:134-1525(+)